MFVVSRDAVETASHEPDCPVYMQDWFVDTAGHGRLARKLRSFDEGERVGSLVYTLHRNGIGMKQGYNLPWARLCGPQIPEHIGEPRRSRIVRDLIRQLPTDVSYFLTVSSERDYCLFLQEGFHPAPADNYVILPDTPSSLRASFSSMTRRHIRQAEQHLTVSTTTPDNFISIYDANLRLRRRKPYAPLAIGRNLLEEGLRRGQARIFTAQRGDGEIEAAIACLWDNSRYYYWMTTRRLESDGKGKINQGAVKLLIWVALQDAASKGLIFDFDGVPTGYSQKSQRASQIYEGMGAQQTVRYGVIRETRFEQVAGQFREPFKKLIMKTVGNFMALKMNY